MSDSEDSEQLKIAELQSELKKSGLDCRDVKVDVTDRSPQAMPSDTEQDPSAREPPSPAHETAAVGGRDAPMSFSTVRSTHFDCRWG